MITLGYSPIYVATLSHIKQLIGEFQEVSITYHETKPTIIKSEICKYDTVSRCINIGIRYFELVHEIIKNKKMVDMERLTQTEQEVMSVCLKYNQSY